MTTCATGMLVALAGAALMLATTLMYPIRPALAAPGDVLRRVDIPTQSRCARGDTGISLGLVPGSMIGQDEFAVLLVTSCLRSRLNSLIFLDPSTNPATEVRVIFTRVVFRRGRCGARSRCDRSEGTFLRAAYRRRATCIPNRHRPVQLCSRWRYRLYFQDKTRSWRMRWYS